MRKSIRKKVQEEKFIFFSVFKWLMLSVVIGAIVGAVAALFLKLLGAGISLTADLPYYYLLLPAGLLLSAMATRYLAADARGHGTEKVIEAVHKRGGQINAVVVPVKLAATVITIASGGSAGKEGPCAQIGAGLASVFARLFRFDPVDRKKLVVCGISAAFASVFGTPMAGALFGVEVLFVGSMMYDVLLPSFVAGMISFRVTSALGVEYFYHPLQFVPAFTNLFFLKIIAAGVFFGLVSFFFIESMRIIEKVSGKLKLPALLKPLIGGLALVALASLFSTRYLGLGLDTIQFCLEGGKIVWYAFMLKAVFTAVTLSFGGSGGVVTPIFFIGTAAGSFFASFFGFDQATFAAIGMVSVLAGAANTPIAASIMAVELFGPRVAPYAALACIISFFITGHRSIYPSQILAFKKSKLVDVEIGRELDATRINL